MGDLSVREGEGQGYVGLELGGVVVEAVGLVAPGADGFGGGGGQEGVSAESANGGDGAVFGDVDFEDDVAGAVGGEGVGGILGLGAAEETGCGLRGRQPDALGWDDLGWGDPGRRRRFYDGIAVLLGGIGLGLVVLRWAGLGGSGLHAEEDFAFFVDD